MAEFPANSTRFDPYKNGRFLLYLGAGTTPVPAVRSVSGLAWNTAVISSREDGAANNFRLGPGNTSFEPVIITRGLTQDRAFEEWASEVFSIVNGNPTGPSLKNLRRDIRINVLNEEGQPVMGYLLHQCWPSSYVPIGPLDANNPSVLIESMTLQYESFERDIQVVEIPET